MISNSNILPFFGLSLLLSSGTQAASWSAVGGGDWDDDANWSTAYYPGGPGAPASENSQISGINGGTRIVELNSNLSTTHDMRIDGGQGASATTLNVNPGGTLNATNAGNSILTINEGGPNTATNSATVNVFTGGTINVGQIRMGRDADGGTSSLNIAGGTIFMSGGGHFEMRSDSVASLGVFSMSAGSFSSGGNRNLIMGNFDSRLNFSGTASFGGQNLTLQTAAGQVGSTDTISVIGSVITDLTFKAINAGPSATFDFSFDAGGVKAIDSLGLLDLDGSSLSVDLGTYTGTAPVVLFGYGSLSNSFGSQDIPSGWSLDTDFNGGSQIALVRAIPEPATGSLAICALVFGLIRRRR